MRKMLVLMALAILTTTATSGCSRCRNLFRRGAPCGGTTLAAPGMLGGAIPLGRPLAVQQPPQMVPSLVTQPNYCCEQAAPVCCDPCPTDCVPCDPSYHGAGYVGPDCGCETATGEYFGGYIDNNNTPPPAAESGASSPGSGTYPGPGTP